MVNVEDGTYRIFAIWFRRWFNSVALVAGIREDDNDEDKSKGEGVLRNKSINFTGTVNRRKHSRKHMWGLQERRESMNDTSIIPLLPKHNLLARVEIPQRKSAEP